jgi:hypothetical protein
LKKELSTHTVVTVPEAGWVGKQNGELVGLAAGEFDVFITIDQNLVVQQNPTPSAISVVVLTASSNRFEDIQPLVPLILQALSSIEPGTVVRVGS